MFRLTFALLCVGYLEQWTTKLPCMTEYRGMKVERRLWNELRNRFRQSKWQWNNGAVTQVSCVLLWQNVMQCDSVRGVIMLHRSFMTSVKCGVMMNDLVAPIHECWQSIIAVSVVATRWDSRANNLMSHFWQKYIMSLNDPSLSQRAFVHLKAEERLSSLL